MPSRVVIRGIGLVTPLGVGVEPTWRALLAGEFITSHARCPVPDAANSQPEWQLPRVNRLALLAAREAVSSAGWTAELLADDRTALVVGTSRGPADYWLEALSPGVQADQADAVTAPPRSTIETSDNREGRLSTFPGAFATSTRGTALTPGALPPAPSADRSNSMSDEGPGGTAPVVRASSSQPQDPHTPNHRVLTFGLSDVASSLAATLRLGSGPRFTLSGACASGLHALIRAAMLIEQGDADRAIVVAAESSLHPMFVESFRRLGVLVAPGERCRPFDVERTGFLCAEAAAAVVLERLDPRAAAPRPASAVPTATIDRYAIAADAAHLTGSDPTGATLKRVLAEVIDGRPVDVIHAHGTGTVANDAAEAEAIDAVLSPASTRPSVYSHKGAIGHTVGAAGLTSVVLNVLMHRRGSVPPNVGVRTPMNLGRATIGPAVVHRPIRRTVAVAAGFGGATAAVSLVSTRTAE